MLVLAGCLAITLPLELVLGARVYRRPARAVRAVAPAVLLFAAWDFAAITAGDWSFDPRYILGWRLPLGLPVEELAFFVVVPLCALLTYEAVKRLTGDRRA